jgi:hypothetical protein
MQNHFESLDISENFKTSEILRQHEIIIYKDTDLKILSNHFMDYQKQVDRFVRGIISYFLE